MVKVYRVYINGRHVGTYRDKKSARSKIDDYPFGSLYEVRDEEGRCHAEFVPF